ncbi:hypothetical protein TD95_005216 [Thielaviopsis punctulata]|uniref:DNA polymerase n=1 Tax=Thielaviopsis punctulata TaxID=72032 RepID=A0A0F4ZHI3_9PEZI|nr:hypothetical protein TD95_005216 [Thielaviopsis punctulata]
MDGFRVQINGIDHYQAQPSTYDPVLRNDVSPSQMHLMPKVPVIRVFGSTEARQKLPLQIAAAYIYRLHMSIDRALAVSFPSSHTTLHRKDTRFVARITLVKGIPFYGFYVGYRYYLKIYMLNPNFMTRLVDLLQNGAIMQTRFQPYEAHIQYIPQFLIDYNLFGCDWLESSVTHFRAPVPMAPPADGSGSDPDDPPETHSPFLYTEETVPFRFITDSVYLPRSSYCMLEVDICVWDIQNRLRIKERPLHHDFVERLHPIPESTKLVPSMAQLWQSEERRRRTLAESSSTFSALDSPFPPEVLVSMSPEKPSAGTESRRTGFLDEDNQYDQVAQLIEMEYDPNVSPNISFSNFVRKDPQAKKIRTVMQAIEDLYPHNLRVALGLAPRPDVGGTPESSIDVDEVKISMSQTVQVPPEAAGDSVDDAEYGPDVEPDAEPESAAPGEPKEEGFDITALLASFSGISRSGLATGHPPEVPITASLVSLASDSRFSADIQKVPGMTKGRGKRFFTSSPSGTNGVTVLKRTKLGPDFREICEESRSLLRGSGEEYKTPIKNPASNAGRSSETKRVMFSTEHEMVDEDEVVLVPMSPLEDTSKPAALDLPVPSSQETIPLSPDRLKAAAIEASSWSVRSMEDGVVQVPSSQRGMLQTSTPQETSSFLYTTPLKNTSRLLWPASSPPPASASVSGSSTKKPRPSFSYSPRFCLSQSSASAPTSQPSTRTFHLVEAPPTVKEVCATFADYGLPDEVSPEVVYSNEREVPSRPREYGGKELRIKGTTLPYLPEFCLSNPEGGGGRHKASRSANITLDERRVLCSIKSWEIFPPPPSFAEVSSWAENQDHSQRQNQSQMRSQNSRLTRFLKFSSQIDGPTQKTPSVISASQRRKSRNGADGEARLMSIMSVEVFMCTRGSLAPDPELDEVKCIFWSLQTDKSYDLMRDDGDVNPDVSGMVSGIIVLAGSDSEIGSEVGQRIRRQTKWTVQIEDTELEVLTALSGVVRRLDPDILTGFEVQSASWGFLLERASVHFDYDLSADLARVRSAESPLRTGRAGDRWGFTKTSTVKVTGRHVINLWRAMRSELSLLQYSLAQIAWHVLGRRIPHYSHATLTGWWKAGARSQAGAVGGHRALGRLIRYMQAQTVLNLEILEANELVPRTREQARLLGVDFFAVVSRGSQFKVESMMSRIARPENFVFVSPSRRQVGGQNALECLPLVMEPQSALYTDPVVVLDFQSLYPSVMIAYNYCYSTFLGRIVGWGSAGSGSGSGTTTKMGFTEYQRAKHLLELLHDSVTIAPNGMLYVTPAIRTSLLAKMLRELLETRVMVKSGLKQAGALGNRPLQQLLNNRQLALKLLANVTYGYTSASYSGRMPCAEIADSIVQTGRETLERAIALIHAHSEWNAEVVYGDTDSLFIRLAGRTRAQAFDLADEMASAITAANPKPVRIKFEKVYQPCVLLAKKRYVGYKWESRSQTAPIFEAKGIETVRRDGTPAEQKIEEGVLRILFDTADLSQVKAYFQAQATKILRGSVSLRDFCFAKEVKLGTYSAPSTTSRATALPPGALLAAKQSLTDPRAEAQYGARIPYLVAASAPGTRLADRCISPAAFLASPDAHIDAEYYLSKNIIPPLDRILNLVGASARRWFDEMPKIKRLRRVDPKRRRGRTLEDYLHVAVCTVCAAKMSADAPSASTPVCGCCLSRPVRALEKTQRQMASLDMEFSRMNAVCRACSGVAWGDDVCCESLDCDVYWARVKMQGRLRSEGEMLRDAERRLLLEW